MKPKDFIEICNVVKLENRTLYKVESFKDGIVLINDNKYIDFNDYDENLKHNCNKELDIIEIYEAINPSALFETNWKSMKNKWSKFSLGDIVIFNRKIYNSMDIAIFDKDDLAIVYKIDDSSKFVSVTGYSRYLDQLTTAVVYNSDISFLFYKK